MDALAITKEIPKLSRNQPHSPWLPRGSSIGLVVIGGGET